MPDYNFLESLRLKNLFGPDNMVGMGNDLPQQGGIMGNIGAGASADPFAPKSSPFEGIFGNENPATRAVGPTALGGGPQAPSSNGLDDIATRMNSMYTPETKASDRYNNMIDTMPVRNKPGMLRKIASVAAGIGGGPEMFDMAMYGNYNNEMKDWKEKAGPAREAATLERQSNVNERTLAYQTIASQLREDAIKAKETNDERRISIAQQRADVYSFKAQNPDMKFDFTGPTIKVINPRNGEIKDSGWSTGNMSDADKMALGHSDRLSEIAARGDEARLTQDEGHEDTLDEIAARGDEARTTRATPSGATGAKGELPTQTRVRQFNAARELANTRPDLKPFIKVGNPGSSDFTITPPSVSKIWGRQGPTMEQYAEIQKMVYGAGGGKSATNQGPGIVTKKRTVKSKVTGETKTQTSRDGGVTWKDD